MRIVYVTSDSDDILHQNTILRLCENYVLFKFTADDFLTKKKSPKLYFVNSKNAIKTLLWIIRDNPGFDNKNICVYTKLHRMKLAKLIKVQRIQEKISGNLIICTELVQESVADVWINVEYTGLDEFKQILQFMSPDSQVITIISKVDKEDIDELQDFIQSFSDTKINYQ